MISGIIIIIMLAVFDILVFMGCAKLEKERGLYDKERVSDDHQPLWKGPAEDEGDRGTDGTSGSDHQRNER